MSKYYKAEDVGLICIKNFANGDVLSAIRNLPTIEVSEDCISREQAIEAVKNNSFALNDDYFEVNGYATIEELEGLPSVVPKTRPIVMQLDVTDDVVDRATEQIRAESEDCISREWLEEQLQQIEDITAMAHIDLGEDPYDETEEITMPISTVRKIIKNAPSVVPTTEQSSMVGEWVIDEYGIPHCSECNCINNTVYRNYCPNCGADMKKTKNN